MDLHAISIWALILAALFAAAVFGARYREFVSRPFGKDLSPAKGSAQRGVAYAFTLGMAPWVKESTRRHWVAYVRGILFHVGIFAGLAALAVSPGWALLPFAIRWVFASGLGLGAVCGLAGGLARWIEPGLRSLSTVDDHIAVWLVTLFLAAGAGAMLAPDWLPAYYFAGALMLIYAPLGKIRHCLFFFFSRGFFGVFVGRRAVIHTEATP